ncbi:MAG: 50S ribosomal protein L1, partial [Gammaproteobacteria bacterium]
MAISKRVKSWADKIDSEKFYPLTEALQLLKECSTVKFDESVEIAVNLGIDARKSDQAVRGATVLPKGTGKTVRVAVFAQGEQAEA